MRLRAAIILGGQGRRMGGALKALLDYKGRRIIDRQLEILRPRFEDIVLCTSRAEPFAFLGLPIRPDPAGAVGPIGGLLAALEWARGDDVFVVAGDMPLLSGPAVDAFIAHARQHPDGDVVACRVAGIAQPLHAIYRGRSLGLWKNQLRKGERSLRLALESPEFGVSWIAEAELQRIDPDGQFLFNVNMPADVS